MPNWCNSSYAITGDEKMVKEIYTIMHELESMSEPLVENGFGVTWLGCLVKRLGEDPSKVYCRGEWRNLSLEQGVLRFDTESAWSRPNDVFEDLLLRKYGDIEVYFIEEELGMDIFQTNDESGQFFNETVIIDSEEDGMEYYTPEEALDSLSELLGIELTDWEKAWDVLEKYNQAPEREEEGNRIWVHRVDNV